jgi:hypothetical protein
MSIAAQFATATASARNFSALDEISRTLWQAHAAGALSDNAAQAAAEAVEARRQVLKGPRAPSLKNAPTPPLGRAARRTGKGLSAVAARSPPPVQFRARSPTSSHRARSPCCRSSRVRSSAVVNVISR